MTVSAGLMALPGGAERQEGAGGGVAGGEECRCNDVWAADVGRSRGA